jgi:membrane protein CcdC involved in cytochrome C biogenesis
MKKVIIVTLCIVVLLFAGCKPTKPENYELPTIKMDTPKMWVQIPNNAATYAPFVEVVYFGIVTDVNTTYSRTSGYVPYTIFPDCVVFVLNGSHCNIGVLLEVVE